MQNIGLIFLVFAFVFDCIAAFIMVGWGRWNFVALGLAFWIASELIGGIGRAAGFSH